MCGEQGAPAAGRLWQLSLQRALAEPHLPGAVRRAQRPALGKLLDVGVLVVALVAGEVGHAAEHLALALGKALLLAALPGAAGLMATPAAAALSATAAVQAALGAAAVSEQSEQALQGEFQRMLDTLRGRGRAEMADALACNAVPLVHTPTNLSLRKIRCIGRYFRKFFAAAALKMGVLLNQVPLMGASNNCGIKPRIPKIKMDLSK